jgi:hypothetical protein
VTAFASMIEVKLISFFVDGDKLHMTLQFPESIKVVDSPVSLVATPTKPKRQDILKCKTIEHVYHLLKNAPEMGKILREYQDGMNETGERLTVRKAAEKLFPASHDLSKRPEKKREAGEAKPALVRPVSAGRADTSERFEKMKEAGYTYSNYIQRIGTDLSQRYENLLLFCSLADDNEFAEAINERNS